MMKQLFIFICVVISFTSTGYGEYILYNWFLLPVTNISLTYPQILGIGCFWLVFNSTHHDKDSEGEKRKKYEYRELATRTLARILFALLAVGIGWVIQLFV